MIPLIFFTCWVYGQNPRTDHFGGTASKLLAPSQFGPINLAIPGSFARHSCLGCTADQPCQLENSRAVNPTEAELEVLSLAPSPPPLPNILVPAQPLSRKIEGWPRHLHTSHRSLGSSYRRVLRECLTFSVLELKDFSHKPASPRILRDTPLHTPCTLRATNP